MVQISIRRTNILPSEVIEANDFITLTVQAWGQRAVTVRSTIIIDFVKEEVVIPVFNQAYYRGIYTEDNNLQFDENINVLEGYDESVEFDIEGGKSRLFINFGNILFFRGL